MKRKINTEDEIYIIMEDFLEQFDKSFIRKVKSFVRKSIYDYKKLLKKINYNQKYMSCSDLFINDDIKCRCRIFNCENMDNFASTTLQITFQFINIHNGKVLVSINGSLSLNGCNLEEILEFYDMLVYISKNKALISSMKED